MINKFSIGSMLLTALVGLIDLSIISSRVVIYKTNLAVIQTSSIRLPLLREKDEVGTHYISYSTTQRVASRTSDI